MNDADREDSIATEETAADSDSEASRIVRAFNAPVIPSTQFYAFLAASELSDPCRRALIGVYKHVMASILRQIQRAINQACRAKGQILQDAHKAQREQKPPRSNTYYRALFHDSSKRGEISTYLVKNTLRGQFRHLDGKFPLLRKLLSDAPLADIAPFLTGNYVVQNLRQRLSGRFRCLYHHEGAG